MSQYPTYKLSEVADILDSFRKPINSTERTKRIQGKKENELYPYYGATGQVGLIDEFLTDGEFVLVGEDGAPFLEPFKNKSYIIRGKAWVNNRAHILSGKKDVLSNQYLNYFLNSFDYRNYVNGTTRLKLTQGNLTQIPIPLPPLPTQRAIVARIESLFAELDKAVDKLKTARQQLKTYRQAVLNHWLNNEDEKWEMVKLGEVAEIKGGKRLPKGHYYSEKPTEYRYIMAGNLKNNTVSLDTNFIEKATYEVLKHYEVIGGEVYITIVGACIGDVGIIPTNLGYSILTENAAKIVNINNITPDFLAIALRSSFAKTQIKSKILSATLGKLALSRVAEIVVPLPPLPEQQRIVAEIESRLSACESMEQSIAQSLEQAEVLRQSILKKAFSGELV